MRHSDLGRGTWRIYQCSWEPSSTKVHEVDLLRLRNLALRISQVSRVSKSLRPYWKSRAWAPKTELIRRATSWHLEHQSLVCHQVLVCPAMGPWKPEACLSRQLCVRFGLLQGRVSCSFGLLGLKALTFKQKFQEIESSSSTKKEKMCVYIYILYLNQPEPTILWGSYKFHIGLHVKNLPE